MATRDGQGPVCQRAGRYRRIASAKPSLTPAVRRTSERTPGSAIRSSRLGPRATSSGVARPKLSSTTSRPTRDRSAKQFARFVTPLHRIVGIDDYPQDRRVLTIEIATSARPRPAARRNGRIFIVARREESAPARVTTIRAAIESRLVRRQGDNRTRACHRPEVPPHGVRAVSERRGQRAPIPPAKARGND